MQKYENFRNKLRIKGREVNFQRLMEKKDLFGKPTNDISFTRNKLNQRRK
jgi:hypothetical protein